MNNRKKFEAFLAKVPLKRYREKYRPVKIVEMNLTRNIQVLDLLYEIYWDKKQFILFDEFYGIYLQRKGKLLEEFREKIQMCEDCFSRGIEARIYRTWASIITQIQGGYVAEAVFGEGSVKMSEELDRKNADIRVSYKDRVLNYQVKKKTLSGVRGRVVESKTQIEGEFIDLPYEVPSEDYFKNPKKKNGEFKLPYLRFIQDKRLKRLNNGFVIFAEEAFKPKKDEIDKST